MLDCMKKRNSKGFTLAELLVVVAIIAILVAVSIPIFTGKLEEAKKSTDLANIRSAKAAVVNDFLQNEETYKKNQDGLVYYEYQKYYDAESGTLKAEKEIKNFDAYGQTSTTKKHILRMTAGYAEGSDQLTVDAKWYNVEHVERD